MKYSIILHLIIILPLMSCEEMNDLFKLKVDQITYGNCKSITTKSENAERIEFKTVNKNYLQIKHINAWFNCEPGQLLVDVSQVNNTIFIDENEEKPMVNCICPYDLCYSIGPMDYGHYIIELRIGGLLYTKFSVDFNALTSGVIEISE